MDSEEFFFCLVFFVFFTFWSLKQLFDGKECPECTSQVPNHSLVSDNYNIKGQKDKRLINEIKD